MDDDCAIFLQSTLGISLSARAFIAVLCSCAEIAEHGNINGDVRRGSCVRVGWPCRRSNGVRSGVARHVTSLFRRRETVI